MRWAGTIYLAEHTRRFWNPLKIIRARSDRRVPPEVYPAVCAKGVRSEWARADS